MTSPKLPSMCSLDFFFFFQQFAFLNSLLPLKFCSCIGRLPLTPIKTLHFRVMEMDSLIDSTFIADNSVPDAIKFLASFLKNPY